MTLEAAPPVPRLIDGPVDAPAAVLLAHGAGAPMDSPFMAAIAMGLADKGWRMVRFEFPYMARMREISGQSLTPTMEVDGKVLADFDTGQLSEFLEANAIKP